MAKHAAGREKEEKNVQDIHEINSVPAPISISMAIGPERYGSRKRGKEIESYLQSSLSVLGQYNNLSLFFPHSASVNLPHLDSCNSYT